MIIKMAAGRVGGLPNGVVNVREARGADRLIRVCSTTSVFVGPACRSALPAIGVRTLTYNAPIVACSAKNDTSVMSSSAKVILGHKSVRVLLRGVLRVERENGRSCVVGYHRETLRFFSGSGRLDCCLSLCSRLLGGRE